MKSFLRMAGVLLLASSIAAIHRNFAAEELVLPNGAHVLLLPVSGMEHAAVQAIYETGFLDEPEGMTQAAHLIEHLACNGASETFPAREAMRRLNEIGMANAETLPGWMHFDFLVPSPDLKLALQIEAERLTSLRFDQALIRDEALRCYQEVDFVERHPQGGMLKHAFMALDQAWRGATNASIRGGLDIMAPDALRAFDRRARHPGNLLLIVAGGFDLDEARTALRGTIGSVPRRPVDPLEGINWGAAARNQVVRWDASPRALCLAYAPGEDRFANAVLSLWGGLLMQRLPADQALAPRTRSVFCSNQNWPVGKLPFFVYAAASEGTRLDELEKQLAATLERERRRAAALLPRLLLMARQLERQTRLDPSALEAQARVFQRFQNAPEQKAIGLALAQGALNAGIVRRLLGADPEGLLKKIASLTPDQFSEILGAQLAQDRLRAVWIVPSSHELE